MNHPMLCYPSLSRIQSQFTPTTATTSKPRHTFACVSARKETNKTSTIYTSPDARAYLQERKQTRRRQYVQCIVNDNSSSSNDTVRVFIGIHRYLKEKDRTRRRPTTSNKQHRQHLLPTFLPSRFFASQQPILENGAPDCMHSLLPPPKLCLTITIYILFRCDLCAYLISFSSINFFFLIFTNT